MLLHDKVDYLVEDESNSDIVESPLPADSHSSTKSLSQLTYSQISSSLSNKWPLNLRQSQVLLLTGGATLCSTWLAIEATDTVSNLASYLKEEVPFVAFGQEQSPATEGESVKTPEVRLSNPNSVAFSRQDSYPRGLENKPTYQDFNVEASSNQSNASSIKAEEVVSQQHPSNTPDINFSITTDLPKINPKSPRIDDKLPELVVSTEKPFSIDIGDIPTPVEPVEQILTEASLEQDMAFVASVDVREQSEIEAIDVREQSEIEAVDTLAQLKSYGRDISTELPSLSTDAISSVSPVSELTLDDCAEIPCADFVISEPLSFSSISPESFSSVSHESLSSISPESLSSISPESFSSVSPENEAGIEIPNYGRHLVNIVHQYYLPSDVQILDRVDSTAETPAQLSQQSSWVAASFDEQFKETQYFKQLTWENGRYQADIQAPYEIEQALIQDYGDDNLENDQLDVSSVEHSQIHRELRANIDIFLEDYITAYNMQVSDETFYELSDLLYCQQIARLTSDSSEPVAPSCIQQGVYVSHNNIAPSETSTTQNEVAGKSISESEPLHLVSREY